MFFFLFLEVAHRTQYPQTGLPESYWEAVLARTTHIHWAVCNSFSVLMMSHNVELNINYVANLLAGGQHHCVEK